MSLVADFPKYKIGKITCTSKLCGLKIPKKASWALFQMMNHLFDDAFYFNNIIKNWIHVVFIRKMNSAFIWHKKEMCGLKYFNTVGL